jgi:hypothetical protein
MNLHYFLGAAGWLNTVGTWVALLPLLALAGTGNWRKAYAPSLSISLVALLLLAQWDNGRLSFGNDALQAVTGDVLVTLHTLYATFFLVYFAGQEKQKDQRLVLYILMLGFTVLFLLVGLVPVIFFIVNMACALIMLIYGLSASRNLLQTFGSGTRAAGGRLLMVLSLLTARLGVLLLYGAAFVAGPPFGIFPGGFAGITAIMCLGITVGVIRDAGYDPENEEDDDGPYQPLRLDTD